MALVSLGDMAQTFLLRGQNAKLRADIARHSQELSTGVVTDIGKRIAGDFSPLAGIERNLTRLDAFAISTAEAATVTETMQTALGAIGEMVASLTPSLLASVQAGQPSHVDAIGIDARNQFETALARLNTRVGDRHLFSGVATDQPAVADADTILSALVTATAGATTAQDVATSVSDWFDDPAGYATIGYLGSTTGLAAVPVAEGESVAYGLTADDPAMRDTLKGLAMAALLDQGVLNGAPDQRASLATLAGEQLMTAQNGWTGQQARLGVAQERIEAAAMRNSAESASLQIARTGLLSVDPYDAATALQESQTQLETLYSITARLSRLTLVDYL